MDDRDKPNPFEPPRTEPIKNVSEIPNAEPAKEKLPAGWADQKVVVLATFDNPVDAHQLRIDLEENGIEARIGNETTAPMLGLTIAGQSSAFWVEVLILESDAERALVIKQQFGTNDDAAVPEWTCSCGETVDAGFAACWSCMAPYESDNADE